MATTLPYPTKNSTPDKVTFLSKVLNGAYTVATFSAVTAVLVGVIAFTIYAFWTHNLPLIVIISAVMILGTILKLVQPGYNVANIWELVFSGIGTAVFYTGIWQHNSILIIMGINFMIIGMYRTFTQKI